VKSVLASGILLIAILFGVHSQANAQARGSVRYTIVVTEDMLVDNRGTGLEGQWEQGGLQAAGNVPSTRVSVALQNNNMDSATAFEAEMSAAQSQEIVRVLHGQFEKASESDAMAQPVEELTLEDAGHYLVVMEFN